MDANNYRNRVLNKLAEDLDLPKLNFQVIRRTIATLGKTKGHVKDIQGMMRHSKASTTTDVYMQSLEPEVRSTINSIHSELVSPRRKGLTPPQAGKLNGNPPRREQVSVARVSSKRRDLVVSEAEEMTEPESVRGVVLEFATKMRQSRGREVALND